MESLMIKIIESLGVPGIFVAVLYIILQQKIISIIKASEIERMFFTHEKRFVYRLYNRVGMFVWTFIAFSTVSFWVLNKNKYIYIHYANSIVNIFVSIIIITSLIIYLFKNKKWALQVKKVLGENDKLSSGILAFFYVVFVSYFICSVIIYIYNYNLFKNYDTIIFFNSIIVSIIAPEIVAIITRTWLNLNEIYFYYIEDNSKWYLLKPHDNEILVGNKPKEEECMKFKFIESSELKKKTILKENVF